MSIFQEVLCFDSASFSVDPIEFWETLQNDNKCFQKIVEGLYLGNEKSAGLVLGNLSDIKAKRVKIKNNLKEKNITHILCLTSDGDRYFSDEDFHYKAISISDISSQVIDFQEAFDFIDHAMESKEGVLVHCVAGQCRSATIVIAYLMGKTHCTYDHLLKFVQSKRACALPSKSFARQIQNYFNR